MNNNQVALMVAGSNGILGELRKTYPKTVRMLNYDRSKTIEALRASGVLHGYKFSHDIPVHHRGTDNLKAWYDYKDEIIAELSKLCENIFGQGTTLNEDLMKARDTRADYIWRQYYYKYPRWPGVGQSQSAAINLNITAQYPTENNRYVVWNCVGVIYVTDRRPSTYEYVCGFTGSPDIKVLIIDFEQLGAFERMLSKGSFEDNVRELEHKYGKSNQLTWDMF